jgi:hypothetical protein
MSMVSNEGNSNLGFEIANLFRSEATSAATTRFGYPVRHARRGRGSAHGLPGRTRRVPDPLPHLRALRPEGDRADPLDLLVYLDADEADLEARYVGRFLGFWEAAEHDPASFYARFRGMDRDAVTGLARRVWEGVNLPNLRQHIVRARPVADLVVRKGADHAISAIAAPAG